MRTLLACSVLVPLAVHAEAPMPHRHPGVRQVLAERLRPAPDKMLEALSTATAWINSPPIPAESLRGKVVLIDFWTFTCINWRRTAPSLRAWVERYGPQGLVVIGVHSPEFSFERDLGNVRQAAQQIGVGYPIAVDTDFAIWRAFGNDAWPALYLFDRNGRMRHRQLGEDAYAQAEQVIRELLAEGGHPGPDARPTVLDSRGAEVAADWANLASPENYLGAARTTGFASPGGLAPGVSRSYGAPRTIALNRWALAGTWTVTEDRAHSDSAPARVVTRFHARDVNLVAGPSDAGKTVRFRVLVDGHPVGAAHGVDVDAEGRGTLREQRMYQLVRQSGPIEDRVVEIEFLDGGAELFSFTFG